MSDIAELAREALERAEAATDGPWRVERDSFGNPYARSNGEGNGVVAIPTQLNAEANASFIAHARQDVPDLARAVLDQQAEIERLTSLLELAEFGANSPHLTWNKE